MSEFKQLYSPLLEGAVWYPAVEWALEESSIGHWLLESDSLSRRLAAHCRVFSVTVLEQKIVNNGELSLSERALLGMSDCLERTVMLQGDQQSWVYARTLIPTSILCGEESDLAELGSNPLGYRVFNGSNARRDALEIAKLGMPERPIWARRSRLWINEKPLLVAELFLDGSPVYARK
ncbi:chorismate--pyruvate lyase family protein [Photobacterium leiognathi]|uniref:chorismate--pyruvate lyase family protein n=1 Tax=Photobacterium leiognathi TaxID=553611 RepID=UPI00298269FA|nr:chorismate lyase [Photobacterium leiognathi]